MHIATAAGRTFAHVGNIARAPVNSTAGVRCVLIVLFSFFFLCASRAIRIATATLYKPLRSGVTSTGNASPSSALLRSCRALPFVSRVSAAHLPLVVVCEYIFTAFSAHNKKKKTIRRRQSQSRRTDPRGFLFFIFFSRRSTRVRRQPPRQQHHRPRR